jgi:glycosyltransferase involved in cell wall biosynthesis
MRVASSQVPRISVIIPAFNAAVFLAEAIESALGQTLPPREVIVVDDGSTDATAEVAQRFAPRTRYAYQANQGIGAARNLGVALATGELLSFLDADDRWSPDKLALQASALAAESDIDLVFGHVRQVPQERWAELAGRPAPPGEPVYAGVSAGTLLTRREAFERVGPFRTVGKFGEFLDWYARAQEFGLRHRMLPEVVLWRRLHDSNQGVRERQALTDYAVVLKAALDRRRGKRA